MLNIVTAKPKTPFEDALADILKKQTATGEDWVLAVRQQGQHRFEELGTPTRRQESWRYVDLADVFRQTYVSSVDLGAPTVSAELVNGHTYPECLNSRVVFVNGVYQVAFSDVSALPSAVQVTELSQAWQSQRPLLEGLLARQIATEPDPFVALNTALINQGVFINVPKGLQVEIPLQLLFLTVPDAASPVLATPRVVLSVGENAKLTVVQSDFGTANTGASTLNNTVVEFQLAHAAELEWTAFQAQSTTGYAFATIYGFQQADSRLVLNAVNLGGKLTRNNMTTALMGEGASCQLNGLSVLGGKSQVFEHTQVEHQVPNCSSQQTTKNILDGHSITEFDGTILIRVGAQQTDSQQLNRNLLLSNDAKAYTRPQLKIDADDVKCAHGATVGQLNDEEIFYLTSRGLSQETARGVLTLGFAEELLDRISVSGVREHLDKLIRRQLAGQTAEGGVAPWVL